MYFIHQDKLASVITISIDHHLTLISNHSILNKGYLGWSCVFYLISIKLNTFTQDLTDLKRQGRHKLLYKQRLKLCFYNHIIKFPLPMNVFNSKYSIRPRNSYLYVLHSSIKALSIFHWPRGHAFLIHFTHIHSNSMYLALVICKDDIKTEIFLKISNVLRIYLSYILYIFFCRWF